MCELQCVLEVGRSPLPIDICQVIRKYRRYQLLQRSWPTRICHYRLQSSQWRQCHCSTSVLAYSRDRPNEVTYHIAKYFTHIIDVKQYLSYRKQIARKLRTQYVEGIHRPKYYTMTLKSRWRVTQGHWKRNHWTDHTRLLLLVELFDVKYYRDLEMWVRDHSRSLKVVRFESFGTVSYSPSIVTMTVSAAILEIFSVKEWPDLEIWVWGPSRSLKMPTLQSEICFYAFANHISITRCV